MSPYPEKTHHKKGLVEWFKVKALNLNSGTAEKKKIQCRKRTKKGRKDKMTRGKRLRRD
jgi:hypothetical protein